MTLSGKAVTLGLVLALVVIIWRVRILRALLLGLAAGAAIGAIR